MGSARNTSTPMGYTKAYEGDNFDIYVQLLTAVEHVETNAVPEKILDNGTLYILKDGVRYTLDGRKAE